MAGNQNVTVTDLAAAVVAEDDELRGQLKALVSDMIGHMRYTMRHGDPAAKLALAKNITPQLLSSMQKVESGEGDKERRAAYERMMRELRGDPDDSSAESAA